MARAPYFWDHLLAAVDSFAGMARDELNYICYCALHVLRGRRHGAHAGFGAAFRRAQVDEGLRAAASLAVFGSEGLCSRTLLLLLFWFPSACTVRRVSDWPHLEAGCGLNRKAWIGPQAPSSGIALCSGGRGLFQARTQSACGDLMDQHLSAQQARGWGLCGADAEPVHMRPAWMPAGWVLQAHTKRSGDMREARACQAGRGNTHGRCCRAVVGTQAAEEAPLPARAHAGASSQHGAPRARTARGHAAHHPRKLSGGHDAGLVHLGSTSNQVLE